MIFKLSISKPGYDAETETNPDNLRFDSRYNTLKYYLDGNVDITIAGDGTDKSTESTITHNLGYVPFFVVYVDNFVDGLGYYLVPFASSTFSVNREAEAWADTTKLYFRLRNKSANTYTAHFYYKIFKNRLGL